MPNVWKWQDLSTWEQIAWEMLADILDERVVRLFRNAPPEHLVADDLSWLNKIVQRATGDKVATTEMFALRLESHFSAIRAFHGARPTNVNSYYEQGFRVLDAEAMNIHVRSLLLTRKFPELTDEIVSRAIEKVGAEVRQGRLYFEASESMLIDHCAHYMLYGSEYLTAIAAQIGGEWDYRSIFLKIGTPTIFVCDVPITHIGRDALEAFAGKALVTLFDHLLHPDLKHPRSGDGFSICVWRDVSPEHIVRHYHRLNSAIRLRREKY